MEFSTSDKFTWPANPARRQAIFSFSRLPTQRLGSGAGGAGLHLQAKLPGVGLMLRCCSAPAVGGQPTCSVRLAEFSTRHAEMGRPRVILACSSCCKFQNRSAGRGTGFAVGAIRALGLPEELPRQRRGRVYPDPCSTRHERRMHECAPVGPSTGYQVEELPLSREKTTCCSWRGDVAG
jgi:hypothetical protein